MSDFKIPITGAFQGGSLEKNDRLLTFEDYGVKKLEVATTATMILNAIRINSPGRILEFPAIGASLPCVFTVDYLGEGIACSIRVLEYGNQPDPDYFNITGVDDFGKPLYPESVDVEQKA